MLYTAKGRASVRDALAVKQEIEADYRARLGDKAFESLRTSLANLSE